MSFEQTKLMATYIFTVTIKNLKFNFSNAPTPTLSVEGYEVKALIGLIMIFVYAST